MATILIVLNPRIGLAK